MLWRNVSDQARQTLVVADRKTRNGLMTKVCLATVQSGQEPLLTLKQDCEFANRGTKAPDTSWCSAQGVLHHCRRTQPRVGTLQGKDYILLLPFPFPPQRQALEQKKILFHPQHICAYFIRATAQMLFSSSHSSAHALRTC